MQVSAPQEWPSTWLELNRISVASIDKESFYASKDAILV